MRPKKFSNYRDRTRINQAIKAGQLRVIGVGGDNLGVISRSEALKEAEKNNLDLIEISPAAKPPVAKIMDFGQYRYQTSRKAREIKSKSHTTETKTTQVKIGTGDHDQKLKAKRIAEWLTEGHRVKVDLFLWGRYKYMESSFLKERLERFLKIIPIEYKVADEIKKSPKGYTTTIERSGSIIQKQKNQEKEVIKIEKTKEQDQSSKSKKKSLDELLELEGGTI